MITIDAPESRTTRGHAAPVTILSVRVQNISVDEVLASIERMISQRTRESIIPVNPEMIMTAQRNDEFRRVINGASITLPDGVGVVVASRLLRSPIVKRLTGIDTVINIAELAERRRYRIFFLGARDGVAERAAARLREKFPNLIVAGTFAGSPNREEEESIRERINRARPDILLVAYGAPRQELWLNRNRAHLDVPVAMCVGGTFDFLAGETSRAPKLMQDLGIEWLYRLVNEPWRWKRMLALPRFACAVFFNSIHARI